MKKFLIILLVFTSTISFAKNPSKFKRTKDKKESFIPSTLDESIVELDTILSDSAKYLLITPVSDSLTRNERIMMYQQIRSFGQWIRNNWGLWKGSSLADWFRTKNVNHPDHMSGIILTTYKAHLKNEQLDLDSLFNYYIEWEEKNMTKVKENGPK